MVKYAHLIPLFPFLAFAINILVGRRIKRFSAIVAISASAISLILSALTFRGYLGGAGSYTLFKWLDIGNLSLNFGVIIDPLSCMMLLVVTTVGTLIQIYSIGYMRGDPRFSRFFAYLSLFMASMLGIVLADNFVMLYIFWEGVGLCSYLLISFWFERLAAARAGMKAFITTRIGDVGLLIGIFILFLATKTFSFSGLEKAGGNNTILSIAALLIFAGAIGKSAQLPLHVWLPDAMEGPTPVSALIHAATMVTAGVYLVARTFPLFLSCQTPLIWVSYVGALTAVFAASIATVNNDIKRILAYSTISQLGLMMMGLGVGARAAGTFHMMTHAFFKALLFLCAGSIIHSIHTQDIRKMGGVFRKIKATGTTLIIAGLAIAGVPPLSGFWSKDEILTEALKTGHPILFAVGILTSVLTSFYIFRLIFLVLFKKARSEFHAQESPKVMTIPLSILAGFAIFAGFVHFGGEGAPEASSYKYLAMAISTAAALAGIASAYSFYMLNNKILPQKFRAKFKPLFSLIENKFYIDEIYELLFIRPSLSLANLLFRFDNEIIDSAVNNASAVTVILSNLKSRFDTYAIDGLVNAAARNVRAASNSLRKAQTGLIQWYLKVAFYGLAIIMLIKMMKGEIWHFHF